MLRAQATSVRFAGEALGMHFCKPILPAAVAITIVTARRLNLEVPFATQIREWRVL